MGPEETSIHKLQKQEYEIKLKINFMNYGKWTYKSPAFKRRITQDMEQFLTCMLKEYCDQKSLYKTHIVRIKKISIWNPQTRKKVKISPKSYQLEQIIKAIPFSPIPDPISMTIPVLIKWKWPASEIYKKVEQYTKKQGNIYPDLLQRIKCPISLALMDIPYRLQCNHIFDLNNVWDHFYTYKQNEDQNAPNRCPLCRKDTNGGQFQEQLLDILRKVMQQ